MDGPEVREIGEDELEQLVAIVNAVDPNAAATVPGLVDWRRQAADMAWLLAERDSQAVGGATVLVGWHAPPDVGIVQVAVLPPARRAGSGSALLRHASAWASERGARELRAEVREDDAASLGWAERRGFREVGRNSLLALDLSAAEPPPADPPPGISIVPWADRPELARGMYEVAREATPDIPGNEDDDIGSFEEWLSRDMQGEADRPEATFVALAGEEVVGFAKLAVAPDERDRAFHDLTGVKRAWRGRGIAAALKRTQIAWAKEHGFSRLQTTNEERNEPIRRLNVRYGYRPEPGYVVLRGPVSAGS
jgi:mycothiol synthase